MKIEDIRRVLIIGAGTMGQQIGLQCALHDYEVTLYDINSDALVAAMKQISVYATQLVNQGRLSQKEVDNVLACITTATDPEKASDNVDLLSESVPEIPELKSEVFAQFGALCPPRTIFTTNTSTLVPSMFAEASGRPERFAAFHFHGPMYGANVVDIMPHPGTSDTTVELLKDFARRIGQLPIIEKKESPGYVFNALIDPVFNAAIKLLVNEVASLEDIDRAWMGTTGMACGPFGLLDVIGIDTVLQIIVTQAQLIDDPEIEKGIDFLQGYVDKGWLGLKSGRGFYSYPEPSFQEPDFLAIEQAKVVPA